MRKVIVFLFSMALFLCTVSIASALSYSQSVAGNNDYIDIWNNGQDGPDTSFTYLFNLPNWYNSNDVTQFNLTLNGYGDNSYELIHPYVSFDSGTSWDLVSPGKQAPYSVKFTLIYDLLDNAQWFDPYDSFLLAYGCHFNHQSSEITIEQNSVPEPATMLLLGAGLLGLAGLGRKKMKKGRKA